VVVGCLVTVTLSQACACACAADAAQVPTWHTHDVHVPLVVLTPPATCHALIPPALWQEVARNTRMVSCLSHTSQGAMLLSVTLDTTASHLHLHCHDNVKPHCSLLCTSSLILHKRAGLAKCCTPPPPPSPPPPIPLTWPMVHHFAGSTRLLLLPSTRRAKLGVISGRRATRRPPLSCTGSSSMQKQTAVSRQAIGLARVECSITLELQ
jgi:hypothetical protein